MPYYTFIIPQGMLPTYRKLAEDILTSFSGVVDCIVHNDPLEIITNTELSQSDKDNIQTIIDSHTSPVEPITGPLVNTINGLSRNIQLAAGSGMALVVQDPYIFIDSSGTSGGGITTINGENGPGITIANGPGITIVTTSDTLTLSADLTASGFVTQQQITSSGYLLANDRLYPVDARAVSGHIIPNSSGQWSVGGHDLYFKELFANSGIFQSGTYVSGLPTIYKINDIGGPFINLIAGSGLKFTQNDHQIFLDASGITPTSTQVSGYYYIDIFTNTIDIDGYSAFLTASTASGVKPVIRGICPGTGSYMYGGKNIFDMPQEYTSGTNFNIEVVVNSPPPLPGIPTDSRLQIKIFEWLTGMNNPDSTDLVENGEIAVTIGVPQIFGFNVVSSTLSQNSQLLIEYYIKYVDNVDTTATGYIDIEKILLRLPTIQPSGVV